MAVEGDRTAIGGEIAGDLADESGFASAIWPNEGVDGALFDGQRDIVGSGERSEGFGEVLDVEHVLPLLLEDQAVEAGFGEEDDQDQDRAEDDAPVFFEKVHAEFMKDDGQEFFEEEEDESAHDGADEGSDAAEDDNNHEVAGFGPVGEARADEFGVVGHERTREARACACDNED